MVLTKEELLKAIQAKLTTEDSDIKILENITDTINSLSNTENEDWKKKYEENDQAWRERYKARFTEPAKVTYNEDKHLPEPERPVSKSENFTIEDLFS